MARLKGEFLERIEQFCDRVVDLADAVQRQGGSRRIVDQLTGCGTSVGANLFEADEAMSRSDFTKCACIAIKELNETRFWVRFVGRRAWIKPALLTSLEGECVELKRILGAMVARTKRSASTSRTDPKP